jgi:hypothetical protein
VKILLDEGVPDIIQKRLTHLAIFTVQQMGWRGVKNGALLDLMAGEFQVIVTADKNLPLPQNLLKREICAVILPTNRIRIVTSLLPKIELALADVAPGKFIQLTAED